MAGNGVDSSEEVRQPDSYPDLFIGSPQLVLSCSCAAIMHTRALPNTYLYLWALH